MKNSVLNAYNQQTTHRRKLPLRVEMMIWQICAPQPQCAAGTLHAAKPYFMAPGAASCTIGAIHFISRFGHSAFNYASLSALGVFPYSSR